MSVILEPTNVIWEFKGIDDGYYLKNDIYWNQLSVTNASACEYAYQNNIEGISTHEGEYQFDLINMVMYINTSEFISPYVKIRRSL